MRKTSLGPDNAFTLMSINDLALSYQAAGQVDRAISLLEEALARGRSTLGADHLKTLLFLGNLAQSYRLAHKADREVPLWREFAERKSRIEGLESPQHSWALRMLGEALLRRKRWAESVLALGQSVAIREAKVSDAWWTFETKSLLGEARLGQKNYAEAEVLLRVGYEGMKLRSDKIPPRDKFRLAESLDRLIELAEATSKPDEAKAWRDEKAKLSAKATAPKTTEENR